MWLETAGDTLPLRSIGGIRRLMREFWVPAVALLAACAVAILGGLDAAPGIANAQQADCVTGVAVPDAADNPGLVSDCEVLLAARDTLAGTAALNWSADTPITRWDGITVEGTPQRVVELDLANNQLTGTIPTELGNLTNLERLYLGYNQLTGQIPDSLSNLAGLSNLYLRDNQLTGCIPVGLRDVENNDFDDLGLPFCVSDYDANNDGVIDRDEVIAAINDYLFPDDPENALSRDEVIAIINLYLFGP